MNKIIISENKTLKLQNVLSCQIDLTVENESIIDTDIDKMNNYIQIHGAKQIGPLIQFSSVAVNEENEAEINMHFMLQSDRFIHNVEPPYRMDSIIRVKNCLYARYIGPSGKVKIAYDKIAVYAFENDIEVEGSNYTIYVEENKEDETMIVDIFAPIKEE